MPTLICIYGGCSWFLMAASTVQPHAMCRPKRGGSAHCRVEDSGAVTRIVDRWRSDATAILFPVYTPPDGTSQLQAHLRSTVGHHV